jgi:hypothetical protein
MTSTLTIEYFINSFDHPMITPIHGEPTYTIIHSFHPKTHQRQYSICTLVPRRMKPRKPRSHHLTTRYDDIIPVTFITPTNPGLTATVPIDTPHEERAIIKRIYTINVKDFQACNTLQQSAKRFKIYTYKDWKTMC